MAALSDGQYHVFADRLYAIAETVAETGTEREAAFRSVLRHLQVGS